MKQFSTGKAKKVNTTATGLKPYKIPEDMIIVVDTREQSPLFLERRAIKGLITVRDTLTNGDYSLRGFENKFMIERKQISDLIPYLTRDHDKTAKKLSRCKEYLFKGLAIEASEADCLGPQLFGNSSPEQIRQGLVAVEMRYGMHIYYTRSRKDLERWVLDRMIKFYNLMRENN